MEYTDHIKIISKQISIIAFAVSEKYGTESFPETWNPAEFPDDEDFFMEIVRGECTEYAKIQGWMSDSKWLPALSFNASQMIAGASPSIEDSFNGQYRKDSFRDVAWGAFLKDVLIELKNYYPNINFCNAPCERVG